MERAGSKPERVNEVDLLGDSALQVLSSALRGAAQILT